MCYYLLLIKTYNDDVMCKTSLVDGISKCNQRLSHSKQVCGSSLVHGFVIAYDLAFPTLIPALSSMTGLTNLKDAGEEISCFVFTYRALFQSLSHLLYFMSKELLVFETKVSM